MAGNPVSMPAAPLVRLAEVAKYAVCVAHANRTKRMAVSFPTRMSGYVLPDAVLLVTALLTANLAVHRGGEHQAWGAGCFL